MMIKKFFASRAAWLVQVIVFLGFVYIAFVANSFPRDSFVAGGDFYQLIEPAEHSSRYIYAWINQIGQGAFNTMWPAYPFYAIIAFFGNIGFNSGLIAGLYIFLQLYLSYWSFYLSIKLFYPEISKSIQIGGSLVYALNNFTLTIFTYPWGFTHHFLFYIFVPPLLLIFLKIFQEERILLKYFFYFAAALLFSVVAYNNLVFLALLFLTQFLLLLVFLVFRQVKINKKFFIKAGIFVIIYALIISWIVVSVYFGMLDTQKIYSNKVLGENYLSNWILLTSNSFFNTVLLVMDQNRFPVSEKSFWIFLSMAYFAVILVLFVLTAKKHLIKKNIYLLALTWIIFSALSTRAYGPLKEIGLFLYERQPLVLFRSPEKIFLLLPFFYTVLLVGLLHSAKLKRKYIYVVFGILLLIPPFYAGKARGILAEKNDPELKYSYLVNIPKEYYDVREIINQDSRDGSVISLPYSVKNSVNWSQYPKWNFIGQDVLHLLYNKFYISANSFDHPNLETKLSFKEFNEKEENSEFLFSLFKKFSGRYVFYHKDIEPEWIEASEHIRASLDKLVRDEKIKIAASNSFFDLYQVNDNEFIPLFDSGAMLTFKKINPVKYRVAMNIKKEEVLEFHQSFDPQWKLYLDSNPSNSWCKESYYYDNAQVTECVSEQTFFEGEEMSYFWKKDIFSDSHELNNEYANSWAIDPEFIKNNYPAEFYKENPDGSIDIELLVYYKTQNYVYVGMTVYTTIFFGFIGYFVWGSIYSRKKKIWLTKEKINGAENQ